MGKKYFATVLAVLSLICMISVCSFAEEQAVGKLFTNAGSITLDDTVCDVMTTSRYMIVNSGFREEETYSIFETASRKKLWTFCVDSLLEDEYISELALSERRLVFKINDVREMEYRLQGRSLKSGEILWEHEPKSSYRVDKCKILSDVLYLITPKKVECIDPDTGDYLKSIPYPKEIAGSRISLRSAGEKYLCISGGYVEDSGGDIFHHRFNLWVLRATDAKWIKPKNSKTTCYASTCDGLWSGFPAKVYGDYLVSAIFFPKKLCYLRDNSVAELDAMDYSFSSKIVVENGYLYQYCGLSHLRIINLQTKEAIEKDNGYYLPLTKDKVLNIQDKKQVKVCTCPKLEPIDSFELENLDFGNVAYSGNFLVYRNQNKRDTISILRYNGEDKLLDL